MEQQFITLVFFFILAIGIRLQQMENRRVARKTINTIGNVYYMKPAFTVQAPVVESVTTPVVTNKELVSRLKSIMQIDKAERKRQQPLFDEKKFYRIMAEYEAAYTIPGLWDEMMSESYV